MPGSVYNPPVLRALVRASCLLVGLTRPGYAQDSALPDATGAPSAGWVRLTLELDRAGPLCVQARLVEHAVEAQLGRSVFVDEGERLQVSVRIAGVPPRLEGSVRAVDARGQPRGQRSFAVSDGCEQATSALALILQLMLQDEAASAAALPAPAVAPPVDAARQPATDAAPERRERRLFVDLTSVIAVGVTPDVNAGLGVALGLPWAALELAATLGLPDTHQWGPVRVDFRYWALGLRACPTLWRGGALRVGLCAGMHGGALVGHATAPSPVDSRALLVALEAGARVELRLGGPLWLLLRPALWVPLSRDTFAHEQGVGVLSPLHQSAPVCFVGEVGLGVDIF